MENRRCGVLRTGCVKAGWAPKKKKEQKKILQIQSADVNEACEAVQTRAARQRRVIGAIPLSSGACDFFFIEGITQKPDFWGQQVGRFLHTYKRLRGKHFKLAASLIPP